MDEFARQIFENAIIKEQVAQRIYSKLLEKASSAIIKEMLQKIIEEEKIHENLFKKHSLEILKIVNDARLKDLNILKDVKKDSLDYAESREINDILDFAILEEEKAYKDYSLLINHLPFGNARDTLKEMSIQELKHKTILQKVKLNFNKNDWSVLKSK